jgi:hypothetical protein
MNSRLNKRVGPLTQKEREEHQMLMLSLRARIQELREQDQ